jgi:hypothetical protein
MSKFLVPALKAIAALTVLSGLVQMVKPEWVLLVVGGESTPTSRHFFGIVGMFMVLFGGLLWQALQARRPVRLALLWCGLQKLGATVAVGLGFMRDLFSWLALGVAGFDLLSCILILAFWWSLRGAADEA